MAARGGTVSGRQRPVACTVAHCQGKDIYSASKPQRSQSRRAEVLRRKGQKQRQLQHKQQHQSGLRQRPLEGIQCWGKNSHWSHSHQHTSLWGAVAAVAGGRLSICDLSSDILPHQFGTHQFSGMPKVREYENWVIFKKWTTLDSKNET